MKTLHHCLAFGLVLCSAPLPARTEIAPIHVAGSDEPALPGESRGAIARAAGIQRAQLALVGSAEGELALARLARESLAAGAAGAGGIVTFDMHAAPCAFSDTQAVNGLVEGVTIRGRFPNGGAILDTCSNFGVAPLSGSNFLAFNNTVSYPPGGVPQLPEIFFLGGTYSSVSVPLSGGFQPGYPMTIVAFGPAGLVDSVDLVTTSGWATHTLSGAGISGILLVGDPLYLVVDDVQYQ
jgi:hypothetical protein